ncbi:hypothetical protein KUC_3136 [Vreelandella boliviensis LC1]|uniref:Uncharacterized protein n=1 Tax=Vreelandella boliviensis LC1 TaxID=1072583 RepID=A0A7U9BZ57_9GAMM|nr:hypothetical protein KUC_3136 [Halomonas boliviensis LC1]
MYSRGVVDTVFETVFEADVETDATTLVSHSRGRTCYYLRDFLRYIF